MQNGPVFSLKFDGVKIIIINCFFFLFFLISVFNDYFLVLVSLFLLRVLFYLLVCKFCRIKLFDVVYFFLNHTFLRVVV